MVSNLKPPRTAYQIESFDPRFKDLLLRGAREEFSIACTMKAQAYAFRNKAWAFRKAHKRAGSDKDMVTQLYRCKVTARPNPITGNWEVNLLPHDDQFDDLFTQAGIERPDEDDLAEGILKELDSLGPPETE